VRGVGWVFTSRLPVRNVKVTRAAKKLALDVAQRSQTNHWHNVDARQSSQEVRARQEGRGEARQGHRKGQRQDVDEGADEGHQEGEQSGRRSKTDTRQKVGAAGSAQSPEKDREDSFGLAGARGGRFDVVANPSTPRLISRSLRPRFEWDRGYRAKSPPSRRTGP